MSQELHLLVNVAVAVAVALVGGLLAAWIGAYFHTGELDSAGEHHISTWLDWARASAYFAPGALVGGVIGNLIIRPVNAGLGVFFAMEGNIAEAVRLFKVGCDAGNARGCGNLGTAYGKGDGVDKELPRAWDATSMKLRISLSLRG